MLYFLYPLAALWSLVSAVFLFGLVREVIRTETRFNIVVVVMILTPLLGMLGYAPWILIDALTTPIIATLREGEWECTESRQKRFYNGPGRSVTLSICQTWSRIQHN